MSDSEAGWADAATMFKQLGQSKGQLFQQQAAAPEQYATRRLSMWRSRRNSNSQAPTAATPAKLARVPLFDEPMVMADENDSARGNLSRQTCDPSSLSDSVQRYREQKRRAAAAAARDENAGAETPSRQDKDMLLLSDSKRNRNRRLSVSAVPSNALPKALKILGAVDMDVPLKKGAKQGASSARPKTRGKRSRSNSLSESSASPRPEKALKQSPSASPISHNNFLSGEAHAPTGASGDHMAALTDLACSTSDAFDLAIRDTPSSRELALLSSRKSKRGGAAERFGRRNSAIMSDDPDDLERSFAFELHDDFDALEGEDDLDRELRIAEENRVRPTSAQKKPMTATVAAPPSAVKKTAKKEPKKEAAKKEVDEDEDFDEMNFTCADEFFGAHADEPAPGFSDSEDDADAEDALEVSTIRRNSVSSIAPQALAKPVRAQRPSEMLPPASSASAAATPKQGGILKRAARRLSITASFISPAALAARRKSRAPVQQSSSETSPASLNRNSVSSLHAGDESDGTVIIHSRSSSDLRREEAEDDAFDQDRLPAPAPASAAVTDTPRRRRLSIGLFSFGGGKNSNSAAGGGDKTPSSKQGWSSAVDFPPRRNSLQVLASPGSSDMRGQGTPHNRRASQPDIHKRNSNIVMPGSSATSLATSSSSSASGSSSAASSSNSNGQVSLNLSATNHHLNMNIPGAGSSTPLRPDELLVGGDRYHFSKKTMKELLGRRQDLTEQLRSGWSDADLYALLHEPTGLGLLYLMKFVESEYSAENLLFWVSARDHVRYPSLSKAKDIYKTFIDENGSRMINISGSVRAELQQELKWLRKHRNDPEPNRAREQEPSGGAELAAGKKEAAPGPPEAGGERHRRGSSVASLMLLTHPEEGPGSWKHRLRLVFDVAQQEIYALMNADTYGRFKSKPHFSDMIDAMVEQQMSGLLKSQGKLRKAKK